MDIKNYIKIHLAIKQMTIDDLARELSKISGKNYTRDSLNGKFYRQTLSVKELHQIAQILDFSVEYKSKHVNL